MLRCIADDAKCVVALDVQRVYLFDYSMGGYLTFDGAMLASTYFAGAAVYAAAIADGYTGIVDRAERKIPVALYIGDQYPYYSATQVRQTGDLLASRGFPVHYLERRGQDHSFAR